MFNEDNTVEQMLIEAATQSSWQYVKSQDIPRSSDSVLVESWLLEALVRLNPITRQQAEQVIYKLRAAITCGGNYDELVTANDRFRTLLFNENTEPLGKDGEYIPIRFFSEDAVEDYCVVTNQWEFPRSSVEGGKRLDLVYLINGIPVCVGEAKSPVRPQITWADGAIDMLHYEKSIPEMFVPNILTFATEGKELQYAGICAPVDKWGPWFNDESRQHGTIESVKSNVMGLVQPNRLLDIYRYYSVFTGTSSGKKIKIVCRYQQYLGGEAIVQRVLNTYREKQGPKKGLIWHFQGSGKSWLMVFAAQKLRLQNELHAPTVVIVDDRIDLEDQITGDFTRADIPNIESAKTKDELVAFFKHINFADEYINIVEKYGYWKDSTIRLEGDAVRQLTVFFLQLFDLQIRKEEDYGKYTNIEISNYQSSGYVQPYCDGPNPIFPDLIGENVYLNMINQAKKSIYIATPYLIIDSLTKNALIMAAKRGVDVKIFTPHIPDKKIIFILTRSNYKDLLKQGVKIYEYKLGFLHTKNFLVDDEIAVVGTINLDYRSLVHHYECGIWMYHTESIAEIKEDFEEILKESININPKEFKLKWHEIIISRIISIFSPLM